MLLAAAGPFCIPGGGSQQLSPGDFDSCILLYTSCLHCCVHLLHGACQHSWPAHGAGSHQRSRPDDRGICQVQCLMLNPAEESATLSRSRGLELFWHGILISLSGKILRPCLWHEPIWCLAPLAFESLCAFLLPATLRALCMTLRCFAR